MSSEWDEHVSRSVGPPPPPPEPGWFTRFLAYYMDFEVNNYEFADALRKTVYAIIVGIFVVAWIALGVILGLISLKKGKLALGGLEKMIFSRKGGSNDLKNFALRDTSISDLTDKVLLSLDADWLKRLEERVMENGDLTGGKIHTQVFCCILPEEDTNGLVECQVKKDSGSSGKKRIGVFKCLSNLIYNFQFGSREDEYESESDNVVKGKSTGSNATNYEQS